MSSLREAPNSKPQTPNIDNADLYSYIGDIVIERAHAGDKMCEDIYTRAYRKTKELLNLNVKQQDCVTGLGWQIAKPATADRTQIPGLESNGRSSKRHR